MEFSCIDAVLDYFTATQFTVIQGKYICMIQKEVFWSAVLL